LIELKMRPALATAARFGLVTLGRRSAPPTLDLVRALMAELLVDPPNIERRTRRR
jgi:hypothetical protein